MSIITLGLGPTPVLSVNVLVDIVELESLDVTTELDDLSDLEVEIDENFLNPIPE